MWVNKLPRLDSGSDDEKYVLALRTPNAPVVEYGGLRVTFIMDRHADGFLIVELISDEFGLYASDVHSFDSTHHAITEWTAIVQGFMKSNMCDKIREVME